MKIKNLLKKDKDLKWTCLLASAFLLGIVAYFLLDELDTYEKSQYTANAKMTKEIDLSAEWSKPQRYEMKIGSYLVNQKGYRYDQIVYNGMPNDGVISLSIIRDARRNNATTIPLYLPSVKDYQVTIPDLNWRITIVDFDVVNKTIQLDVEKLETSKSSNKKGRSEMEPTVQLEFKRSDVFALLNYLVIQERSILNRQNQQLEELAKTLWKEVSDRHKVECLWHKGFRGRLDCWNVDYKDDLIRLEVPEILEDDEETVGED